MLNRKLNKLIFSFVISIIFGVSCAFAEKPILIGAPLSLTGPYASAGDLAKKTLQLLIDETNSQGGLVGRKIKLVTGDVNDQSAEKVIAVMERLAGMDVDAIISNWCSFTTADVKVVGELDIPYITSHANKQMGDAIKDGMPETNNVFNTTWPSVDYAPTALKQLTFVPKSLKWLPPNNYVAVIKTPLPYSIDPADAFSKMANESGFKVVVDETVAFGIADWSATLTKISKHKPFFIIMWNISPIDCARFQKQFFERYGRRGYDGLVAYQWTPSMPEFIDAAGKDAAEGVLWMGFQMRRESPDVKEFMKKYKEKYGEEIPGIDALLAYDNFLIWKNAVERAGCADCYDEINVQIREWPTKGLWATHVFNPQNQNVLTGEGLAPIHWLQIRNGKNKLYWPVTMAETTLEMPPWMKRK